MKNAFYFAFNVIFVPKILKFLSWSFFGYVEKQPGWTDKINFITDEVTTWETNNCNTHIAREEVKSQGVKAIRQWIWSVNRI